jgi:hypothetical protein
MIDTFEPPKYLARLIAVMNDGGQGRPDRGIRLWLGFTTTTQPGLIRSSVENPRSSGSPETTSLVATTRACSHCGTCIDHGGADGFGIGGERRCKS